jgi:hypothetical protein
MPSKLGVGIDCLATAQPLNEALGGAKPPDCAV